MFRLLGRCPVVEPDGLVLSAMLDRSPDEAERVLESLVDASLVQQPTTGRYRLHDLVAVFARSLAAADSDDAVARSLRLFVAAARWASDEGLSSFPDGPDAADLPFTDGPGPPPGWIRCPANWSSSSRTRQPQGKRSSPAGSPKAWSTTSSGGGSTENATRRWRSRCRRPSGGWPPRCGSGWASCTICRAATRSRPPGVPTPCGSAGGPVTCASRPGRSAGWA